MNDKLAQALRHIIANKDKASVQYYWQENGRRRYIIEFYEENIKTEKGRSNDGNF